MLQTRIAILPQSPSCFPLSRNTEEMEDKSKKKKKMTEQMKERGILRWQEGKGQSERWKRNKWRK